ncbi:MAG: VapE family protein, partial [Ignavibacteria bacterium]|nr:VapE family protein [Ignavibacteria bacterium]
MLKGKRSLIEKAAFKYHQLGINVLPVVGKAPNLKWEKWQKERQTLKDIEEMNWNHTTDAVGGVAGINDFRFIDIDGIKDWEILDIILPKLKLGLEYLWIVKSGSGNGAHIIFIAKDDDRLFEILGGKKGVYKFKLKNADLCDHIEIRWSESQTVLPPSKHPSGGTYQFVYDEPKEIPGFIETETLIEFAEELLILEMKKVKTKLKKHQAEGKAESIEKNENYDPEEIETAIDLLAKNLNEDCYNEWMEIGFALASIGEEGRKYFLRLSLTNNHYKDTKAAINIKFDGFLKDYDGRSTVGTLFFYAKKFGYELKSEEKEKKADFFQQTEEHLKEKYDFVFNTLKQKLYWKRKDESDFKEISDRDLATIFIELKSKKKISISYENLRRLLISDFVPKADPLEDYFKNLPEWNGTDYIEMLGKTVVVEEGSEDNWKIFLRKWLIATVACALNDKVVNHNAIILQGPQGVGKTRWINTLVPDKLQDYIFTGNITPNDKDSKLAVVKNFIINLDELETLNREEIGFLKSLMTQKDVELRKPYGYFEEHYKRRSSFIGSINKLEFLNDPTGSRRFLCFAVEKIDYEHDIDIDGVYAQALYLFNKGEKYWFNKSENNSITENNIKFTFQPLEEQLILEKYELCGKDDPERLMMSTTEIAQAIMGDKPFNSNTLRQIGMALNKYG